MPSSLSNYWQKIKRPALALETAVELFLFLIALLFVLSALYAAWVYYQETRPPQERMPVVDFRSRVLATSDLDQVIKFLDSRADQAALPATPPGILQTLR